MVDFAIDKVLKQKIGLMIQRVQGVGEQDNYFIVEGDTGSGKTNVSVGICHEVAKATGREFDVNHIFFSIDDAIDYAKKTKEQIIIFDEPAFGAMKSEWRGKTSQNLTKLLFTARMKRHFIIFNLVKFNRFSEDIIDKAIGMMRVYQPDPSKLTRKFLYFMQSSLKLLNEDCRRTHTRHYNKYVSFRGSVFRYIQPDVIDNVEYNRRKEEAIMSIGEENEKKNPKEQKLLKLQFSIGELPNKLKAMGYVVPRDIIAQAVVIHPETFSKWRKIGHKPEIFVEFDDEKVESSGLIIDKGLEPEKIVEMVAESLNNIV